MTVLHSGTTKKYSDNWGAIFGEGKKGKATAEAKKSPAKPAKKKKRPASKG